MEKVAFLLCVASLACTQESTGGTSDRDADLGQEDGGALPTRGAFQPDTSVDRMPTADAAGKPELTQVALDAERDANTLPCDPVSGSGCLAGLKCGINNTATGGLVRCAGLGTAQLGEICAYSAQGDSCALGLSCFPTGGESKPTCKRLCPWELRGTSAEICAGATRGQCAVMMTALKIAYCI